MYYIRKYSNGIAVHNDDTGESRLLTEEEIALLDQSFIQDEMALTQFMDNLPEGIKV